MPETVAEVLNRAADLLEKPGAWTQGAFALTADGKELVYGNNLSKAVCYCVNGALFKVGTERQALDAQEILRDRLDVKGTPYWNDAPGRTQAEVVQALRAAASQAEGV